MVAMIIILYYYSDYTRGPLPVVIVTLIGGKKNKANIIVGITYL